MVLGLLTVWGCASNDLVIIERCIGTVTTIRPTDSSTDVPIDARILAVLDQAGQACAEALVSFTLELDEEEIEVATGSADPAAGLVHFEPEETLEPLATYDLLVEDEISGEAFEVSFTTGSDLAELYEEPPQLTIDSIEFVDGDRWSDTLLWSATLTVAHVPSDRQLSLLHLAGGESIADPLGMAWANAEGLVTTDVAFETIEADGEVCFTAIQEDETGRGGEASDAACKDLPDVALSCSSLGGRASQVVWLTLPLLLGLRRRTC